MADMEAQVAETVRIELERQAETTGELTVTRTGSSLTVHGPIDLEALSMAVVGTVAGGP